MLTPVPPATESGYKKVWSGVKKYPTWLKITIKMAMPLSSLVRVYRTRVENFSFSEIIKSTRQIEQ